MLTKNSSLVLFIVILTAVVFLFGIRPISDTDTFWHLSTGKVIVEYGLPRTNTFSHTYTKFPYPPTEWLFELILYWVYYAFGLNGMIFLSTCLFLATCLVTMNTLKLLSLKHPLLCLPFFFLFIQVSRWRITSRPEIFTLLGLAVIINLWFRKKNFCVYLILGLTAVIWANSHAGIVFGSILVCSLYLGELLNRVAHGREAGIAGIAREGGIFASVFIPSTLINPAFLKPYSFAFSHLFIPRKIPIFEYEQTTFVNYETFYFFAAITLLGLLFLPRRMIFPGVAAIMPFMVLAMFVKKINPLFGTISLPFLCLAYSRLELFFRKKGNIIKYVLAVLTLTLVVVFGSRDLQAEKPGLGMKNSNFPIGAAKFIKEKSLDGKIYNDYDDGGYLSFVLYPWKGIFQDGRAPAYPMEFFQEILSSMGMAKWQRLMDRYNVDIAIVKRRQWGKRMDFSSFFSQSNWALVYLDGNSWVFLRRKTANQALIGQHAFKVLGPGMKDKNLALTAMNRSDDLLGDLIKISPQAFHQEDDLLLYTQAAYLLQQPQMTSSFAAQGKRLYPTNLEFDRVLSRMKNVEVNKGP